MSGELPAEKQADLFGWDEPMKPKGKRDESARGNAAPIGSGPAGETCKTCLHARSTFAKRYWKCDLVKATCSPKTDIRLKWAACSRWEKKPTTEE